MSDQEPDTQKKEQLDTFSSTAGKQDDRNYTSPQAADNNTSQYLGRSSECSEEEDQPFDMFPNKARKQGSGNSNTPVLSLEERLCQQSSSPYQKHPEEELNKKQVDVKRNKSQLSLTERLNQQSTSLEHSEEEEQLETFSCKDRKQDDGNRNISGRSSEKVLVVYPDSTHNAEIDSEKITHSDEAAEYHIPMKIVVKIEALKHEAFEQESLKPKAEKRSQRSYYDTSGKRGLLCILQNDNPKWTAGNEKDKSELLGFFEIKLKFHVVIFETYSDLVTCLSNEGEIQTKYYCLLIFISEHGNERGIVTDEGLKTNHEISNDFSNENLKLLAGVPKIFILDVCRGKIKERTVVRADEKLADSTDLLPTKTSDCLIIHATTHGRLAHIPDDGSVGLQGVMRALKQNWEDDHLEEMLIDARREVAKWRGEEARRQTLEIQTTLLKRLKFVKYC